MGRVYTRTTIRRPSAVSTGNRASSLVTKSRKGDGEATVKTLEVSDMNEPFLQEPNDIPLGPIKRRSNPSAYRPEASLTEPTGTDPEQLNYVHDNRKTKSVVAVPWVAILMAAAFSSMSFMSLRGSGEVPRRPEMTFRWLATMTATSSLQLWIGMLLTYFRWYQGISHREKKLESYITRADQDGYNREFRKLKYLKKNRAKGQPYLAIYAFVMCSLVLFFYGWKVLVTGSWKVYQSREEEQQELLANPSSFQDHIISVNTFITSYIPIPIYLLLLFGYKLVNQTRMVPLDEMKFWDETRQDDEQALDGTSGDSGESNPTPQAGARRSWREIITLFFA